MLLENSCYPHDTRVRQEARTLVRAGHAVTVISPREAGQPSGERIDGVDVLRFRLPRPFTGPLGYAWEYGYATAAFLLLSLRALAGRGFDVVHAHNPPDTLVLVGAFYRMLGKRFVFDHHDLSPELFAARFGSTPPAAVKKALLGFERLSLRIADLVLATNASYHHTAGKRAGVPLDRIVVVRNGPDLERLSSPLPAEPSEAGPAVIGYLGVIGPQDGVEHLIQAVAELARARGKDNWVCCIAGSGDGLPAAQQLAARLGLSDCVRFLGWLDRGEADRFLRTIDIGVEPAPSNPYNDRCTMIKLMEYMACGKPAVAYALPENQFSAEGAALFAKANDPTDLARAISELLDDANRRGKMGALGRRRIEQELAWSWSEPALLGAYSRLARG